MKTIAFVSRENKTGNTTLAIHLAEMAVRSGKAVTLVDIETQGCMMRWFDRRRQREGEKFSAVKIHPQTFPSFIRQVRLKKFDLIVVDAGRSSKTAETVLQSADLAYFPCRTEFFQQNTCFNRLELFKQKQTHAFVLMNFCQRGQKPEFARNHLQKHNLPVLDFSISKCGVFKTSVSYGRSVLEDDPAGQATVDIKNLFKFTKSRLKF
jgi:cellulose biosynthesis protein BcsQ